jgi:hypothetical protein
MDLSQNIHETKERRVLRRIVKKLILIRKVIEAVESGPGVTHILKYL